MKVLCSWCKTDIKEKPLKPESTVTHGICRDCFVWLSKNWNRSLRDFLNSFDFPIFAIDTDTKVRIVNVAAEKALGKSFSELEGKDGGDAIECAYARLPEGCGNTIHCKACTIRNTVIKTQKTGISFKNVSAYQEIYTQEGIKKAHILISTEKFEDFVILKFQI